MNQEFSFDTYEELLNKWNEIKKTGITRNDITLIAPHPVHGFDDLKSPKSSHLRLFTLTGAILGAIAGFALTIYSVLSWPIITGGKPIVSIPPFIIISYELTILFGGIISFIGFLFLARMPSIKNIMEEKDYGNKYVIIINKKGEE